MILFNKLRNIFKIIMSLTVILLSPYLLADNAQEALTLARINNILNAVYPLINQAKNEADPNTRIKFRYDWLQSDIQEIQAGIAQKINATQIEPRVIPSLQVHYIEQQNKHD